jgi:hypothetical protein
LSMLGALATCSTDLVGEMPSTADEASVKGQPSLPLPLSRSVAL